MERHTKEGKQRRSLRDYGNSFFHIIARRDLGREGYMHALQMGEQAEREAKQEAAKRTSPEDPQRPQPDGNGREMPMPDVREQDQPKTEQEGGKEQPDKPEPQPERPLRHLYEVFTKDTAESNKFLANYEKRLAEHLERSHISRWMQKPHETVTGQSPSISPAARMRWVPKHPS